MILTVVLFHTVVKSSHSKFSGFIKASCKISSTHLLKKALFRISWRLIVYRAGWGAPSCAWNVESTELTRLWSKAKLANITFPVAICLRCLTRTGTSPQCISVSHTLSSPTQSASSPSFSLNIPPGFPSSRPFWVSVCLCVWVDSGQGSHMNPWWWGDTGRVKPALFFTPSCDSWQNKYDCHLYVHTIKHQNLTVTHMCTQYDFGTI